MIDMGQVPRPRPKDEDDAGMVFVWFMIALIYLAAGVALGAVFL